MPGEVSRFRSHLTLALCTLLHAFTHAYGTILVPLYIAIRDDLSLPGIRAASLVVTVYGLVYCLGSYPAGVLADRFNRKALLGVGLVVNAVAILLMGLTRSYEAMIALGVLAGLAGTLFHPAANALATAHYARSPGMAIGVLSIGSAIGFFAGPRFAGWRADTAAGWQVPLVEAGLVGLAFGVVFLIVGKEVRKPRVNGHTPASSNGDSELAGTPASSNGNSDLAGTSASRNGNGLTGTLGSNKCNGEFAGTPAGADAAAAAVHPPLDRTLFWRVLGTAFVLTGRDFAGIATVSLVSIYLQMAHGMSIARAGLIVGSMMLIAVIANPLAVYLSGGRRRLPVLAGVLLVGGVIITCVPHVQVALALPVLCAFQACHLGSYAVSEAAMLERIAPDVRGRVIGIFITVAGTFASTAPWLMGRWTDAMGASAADPRTYALPFGVIGLLHVSAVGSVFLIRKLGPMPTTRQVDPVREIVPQTLEVVG